MHIESFAVSQKTIVGALEKATAEKWEIRNTTTIEQLAAAQEVLKKGDFITPFASWIRAGLFSGEYGCRFERELLDNKLLGLPKENLQEVVEKLLKGEFV